MQSTNVLVAKLERVPIDSVFIGLRVWGQGQQRVCVYAHDKEVVVHA